MAKTPLRPAPEPLEANDTAIVKGGTAVWLALFLVQLPFYGWLREHGHTWWILTPLAGAGLGVFGLWYLRRRDAAHHRATAGQDRQIRQDGQDGAER